MGMVSMVSMTIWACNRVVRLILGCLGLGRVVRQLVRLIMVTRLVMGTGVLASICVPLAVQPIEVAILLIPPSPPLTCVV